MTSAGGWIHRAAWPPAPRHVAAAREFVARWLREHGTVGDLAAAQLVVSELATNAVLHAGTPFTVTLRCHDGHLTIIVRDRSRRQLPDSPPEGGTRSRGRGLRIVESLTTSWGVTCETDGKSVWATLPC